MKKRLLAALLTFCMVLTLLPVSALAADPPMTGDIGKAQATYSDGGLNITKTLTKKDENLFLQFEAYVTGTVTPIETKPLDIVLVLDVSGSMGNTFTSETRYTYDLITGQSNRYIWWDSDNLYTLLEDGETYVPVEMSREPEYMDSYEEAVDWRDRNWTNETCYNYSDRYALYYYDSESGEYQTVTVERERTSLRNYQYTYFVDGDVIYTSDEDASSDRLPDWITFFVRQRSETYTYIYSYTGSDGQIVTVNAGGEDAVPSPADGEGTLNLYLRESDQVRTTKLQAMKDAVNAFIDEVSSSNGDHEIAVVKFADDSYAYDYWNGEYEIGDNRGTNQAQVVSDFSSDYSDLKTAVTGLHASGATAADYGLNLAQAVIDGDANLSGADPEYQKVVVFFTDGEPNHYNGFDATVAEDAVDAAYSLKQDGVTIYTVGVFSGANPEDTNGNFNRYMHGVSSNYPNAQSTSYGYGFVDLGTRAEGSNYYLAADSADALKDIFESIGGDITSSVDVDETAALTDTLTEYFDFGELGFGSETGTYENVSVQVASATGDDQWGTPTDAENVIVTVKGNTISVTGFDYAENAVVNNNGTWQGQKLVLTFSIEIDENADWGPSDYYDTNSAAGLKASDGTEIGMLEDSPNVYVATRQVTYEFVSGTDGMTLPGSVTSQLEDPISEYIFDTGTPANAHADETYTVVEVEGGTWNPGSWSDVAQDDNGNYTYTLTWTFTPDGSATTTNNHAGYFIILPGDIPEDFSELEGYDPEIYMPNSSGDTANDSVSNNHQVDNSTGYIGYITDDAVEDLKVPENYTGNSYRMEIDANDYDSYLIAPTGEALGSVWTDYGEGLTNETYDLVWYQINSHSLSAQWPNSGVFAEGEATSNQYHVDGYIQGVTTGVVYVKNDGSETIYKDLEQNGQPIHTGDRYDVLWSDSTEILESAADFFTRPGYTFTGWNTEPDGSGDSYGEDAVIETLTHATILYAQWAEIVPSVDAEKAAALQDDGTIDYTITITYDNADGASQDGMKHIQITDAKLPASAEDVTIQVVDGTNAVSGNPALNNGILTFALAQPLSENGTITVSYSFNYLDNSDAIEDGKVTNTATVTVWNENEDNGKTDTDTTETEVIYSASDVSKHVVQQNTLIPDEIQDKITGLDITYPDSKQIVANAGETITLLYEISVIGEPGASFNVIEEEGTSYIGAVDSNRNSVEVENFTTIPAQYSGLIPTGSEYVTLYFTKTFSITADTVELTNAATVNGKEVTEEVDVVKPGLNVDKTVKINGEDYVDGMVANEKDVLTYTITVKNNSNAAITGTVTVTDDMWGTADGMIGQVQLKQQNVAGEVLLSGPADVSGGSWTIIPRGTDTQFDAGETWTFTYTYIVTGEDVIVGSVSNIVTAEGSNGDESTDEVTVPAGSITITPADITIYTGGDGYSNVLDENGTPIATTAQGFPEPGYHLTLPDAVKEWLRTHNVATDDVATNLAGILSFRYYDENGNMIRNWDLEDQGVYSKEGDVITAYVYSLSPNTATAENGIKVRLQIIDPENSDKVITTDDIVMGENLVSDTYEMTIYSGTLDQSKIQAEFSVNGETLTCNVEIGTGELLVKSITDIGTTTNAIEDNGDAVASGTLTAVADSTVHYYVNDSEVEVENEADRVQLLVDSVSNNTEFNRSMEQNAINKADAQDGVSLSNAQAESFYLDLVDTDNGNTVVTLGDDDKLTIYWPMPSDADENGEFYIVHYDEMDRTQVSSLQSDPEIIEVTRDGDHLVFQVVSFSPFVLVYEEDDGGSHSGGGGGGSSNDDDDADDDKPELNKEDHIAYVSGYPDGTVQPEGYITREEVATIFFRLLTDSSRADFITEYNPYPDVEYGRWSYYAITTMTNGDLMLGRPGGVFDPGANITRAEFAVVASLFSNAQYSGPDQFTDISDHWARDYINRAAAEGWVAGYPDGTFGPDRFITRAEVMALVNEVLERAPDADYMLEDMTVWPDNPESAWYYEDVQEATNSHAYVWRNSQHTSEDWEDFIPMRTFDELVRDAFLGR